MRKIIPAAEQIKEFDKALQLIQAPLWSSLDELGLKELTQGQQDFLVHEQTCLTIAANWVVHSRSIGSSKRQRPFTSTLYRNHEPWARNLYDLLYLCIASINASESSFYSSPFEHWSHCVNEDRRYSARQFFFDNKSKRELENEGRAELRLLREFKNPWLSDIDIHTHIHKRRLFNIACPMAERTYGQNQKDNFYAKFYAPFLASYQRYIDHPSTKAAGLLVDLGKSMGLKKGPGKAILTVKMEPVEYIKTIMHTQ